MHLVEITLDVALAPMTLYVTQMVTMVTIFTDQMLKKHTQLQINIF